MICPVCGSTHSRYRMQKAGMDGKNYKIHKCENCKVWYIDPIPEQKELDTLYQDVYFQKRTDRGYDNYLSEEVKKSVLSTIEKNMRDIGFFPFEKSLGNEKKSLEIGSAGGYYVEWLSQRGWQATGIDVAREMVDRAQSRGLNIIAGDFLEEPFPENSFQLISMWATLEHLREPRRFAEKISTLLAPGGRVYLSTAHTGFFARIYRENWRYLNVPEHITYYNRHSLQSLFSPYGLTLNKTFTYGSGFTTKKEAGFFYRWQKSAADFTAKKIHSGDMVVAEFIKPS